MTETASAVESRNTDVENFPDKLKVEIELDELFSCENVETVHLASVETPHADGRKAEMPALENNVNKSISPNNSDHITPDSVEFSSKADNTHTNGIEIHKLKSKTLSGQPEDLSVKGKTEDEIIDSKLGNNVKSEPNPFNNDIEGRGFEVAIRTPKSRNNSSDSKKSSDRSVSKSRTNSTDEKDLNSVRKPNANSRKNSSEEINLESTRRPSLSRSTSNESKVKSSESPSRENGSNESETIRANETIYTKSLINIDDLGVNEDYYEESTHHQRSESKNDDRDEEVESSGSEKDDANTSKTGPETLPSGKRRRPSTSSNSSESPSKKLCQEIQKQYAKHDSVLTEYVQSTVTNSTDELQRHTEQLLSEIKMLKELAQAKEQEWNNILHLKKVKEEILLRLMRRKQLLAFEKASDGEYNLKHFPKGYVIDRDEDISGLPSKPTPMPQMPISYPLQMPPSFLGLQHAMHRPIAPKPGLLPKQPAISHHNLNGRSHFNSHMGRQGPVKDVKSIIADYRQRNPGVVPRRGRRMKSILNPMMMNGPRMPGPHLNDPRMTELGLLLTTLDAQSRAAAESHQSLTGTSQPPLSNPISFKDVLIQFAALQHQQQTQNQVPPPPPLNGAPKQPPPPYPEISLHAVETQPVQTSTGSLLHGILTKTNAGGRESPRFTTFSPTLARLLTAPERAPPPTYLQSKNCGEITITPVQPGPSQHQPRDAEIVQLEEDDPDGPADDPSEDAEESDRPLIIDESGTSPKHAEGGDAGDKSPPIPRCQGCRKRDAQFVCAGCANQWYCSRECQVTAWDEHSEHCSG